MKMDLQQQLHHLYKSYDIDLEQRQRNQRGQQIGLKLAGEVFLL